MEERESSERESSDDSDDDNDDDKDDDDNDDDKAGRLRKTTGEEEVRGRKWLRRTKMGLIQDPGQEATSMFGHSWVRMSPRRLTSKAMCQAQKEARRTPIE